MQTTNKEVYIPQLNLRRKMYTDGKKNYIRVKGVWEELDAMKTYLKNQFGMNIEYKFY